jgi:4-amino-4-deoxy-L-arabinose transferase-like glycosyltransferase
MHPSPKEKSRARADGDRRTYRNLWILLTVVLAMRLLTLHAYPLTDNTEARYAEMARKMVETGQWLMPQIDYGVPFWGKPPLSMWLTALSYEALGVHAFAARLPSLLLTFAVCLLVCRVGVWRGDRAYGLRAAIVTVTSLVVLVSAGGVMTDPAMWFGTTLSMLAWWRAWTAESRRWGYAFFAGLAIGLLAKGPIAAVLTMLPIGVWVVATRNFRESARRLPWLGGLVMMTVLVVPWYAAAELHSPGFLRYFLIGEHVERFLVPGWEGDLYGVGHAYPRGTIVGFAMLGTLPWSACLVWQLLRGRAEGLIGKLGAGDAWTLYLACWMCAPVAFFVFSRNILPTYVLPGVVGFALLAAQMWSRTSARWFTTTALLVPTLCVVLAIVAWGRGVPSQQEIVDAYERIPATHPPLVYFRRRPQSAAFYSGGRADQVDDAEALRRYLMRSSCAYVATESNALPMIPEDLRQQFNEVAKSRSGKYMLLHWRSDHIHVDAPRAAVDDLASSSVRTGIG